MKRAYLQNNIHTNKGYTLLFAILVSSLVLAIGISILNINKKELLLTAGARDSSAAFYAADGGLECALYADNNGAFRTDSDQTAKLDSSCSVPHTTLTFPTGAPIFTFEARFGDTKTSCAVIKVDKTPKPNGDPKTVITSNGYNTGWNDTTKRCNVSSPKKVERAIEYSY